MKWIEWTGFAPVVLGNGLQRVSFNVHNSLDFQIQKLAEVSLDSICKGLGCGNGDDIIVRDAHGNEVEYQKSYNGKLLVDASVRPNGDAVFYVEQGQHSMMRNFVYGALYKIRKDDIAWENDRGIYRAYGHSTIVTGKRHTDLMYGLKTRQNLLWTSVIRLIMMPTL